MDKGKIEAMVTKFSEKLAIIMLKKHRKFCRRGLTHLDATPIFKNCSDTYETPCSLNWLMGYLGRGTGTENSSSTVVCILVRMKSFPRFLRNHP